MHTYIHIYIYIYIPLYTHSYKHIPGKRYMGIGVERSFPTSFENAKNSSVTCTHTVCLPSSVGPCTTYTYQVCKCLCPIFVLQYQYENLVLLF